MHAIEEVLCRPLPRSADVEVTSHNKGRHSPRISTAGVDLPIRVKWSSLAVRNHRQIDVVLPSVVLFENTPSESRYTSRQATLISFKKSTTETMATQTSSVETVSTIRSSKHEVALTFDRFRTHRSSCEPSEMLLSKTDLCLLCEDPKTFEFILHRQASVEVTYVDCHGMFASELNPVTHTDHRFTTGKKDASETLSSRARSYLDTKAQVNGHFDQSTGKLADHIHRYYCGSRR